MQFGSDGIDATLLDIVSLIKRAPWGPQKPRGPIINHWVIYSSSNFQEEEVNIVNNSNNKHSNNQCLGPHFVLRRYDFKLLICIKIFSPHNKSNCPKNDLSSLLAEFRAVKNVDIWHMYISIYIFILRPIYVGRGGTWWRLLSHKSILNPEERDLD